LHCIANSKNVKSSQKFVFVIFYFGFDIIIIIIISDKAALMKHRIKIHKRYTEVKNVIVHRSHYRVKYSSVNPFSVY